MVPTPHKREGEEKWGGSVYERVWVPHWALTVSAGVSSDWQGKEEIPLPRLRHSSDHPPSSLKTVMLWGSCLGCPFLLPAHLSRLGSSRNLPWDPCHSWGAVAPLRCSFKGLHFSNSLGSSLCAGTTCCLVCFPFRTENWAGVGLIHFNPWHLAQCRAHTFVFQLFTPFDLSSLDYPKISELCKYESSCAISKGEKGDGGISRVVMAWCPLVARCSGGCSIQWGERW